MAKSTVFFKRVRENLEKLEFHAVPTVLDEQIFLLAVSHNSIVTGCVLGSYVKAKGRVHYTPPVLSLGITEYYS